ncbi:DUF6286 domain-containing protein [Kineococcus gynurae]|uniref:DUF6286 domain-containing protein n=1 Tax=Kineococcus gynurae TaxID=452979 RepID=A0ABV5LU45_9ACTN
MSSPSSARHGAGLAPAPAPTGSGPIGVVGPVLALLLLAVGVLLVRDALVAGGAIGGSAILPAAVDGARGFAAETWLVAVGVVVVLIGLWLVVTALRPRSRRTLPLRSATNTFLHTSDLARLASGAARDVDGVLSASTSASRSKVTVSVQATGPVDDEVRRAVTAAVGVVNPPPRVSVRVSTSGGQR